MSKFTPLDAILNSRLLDTESKVHTWHMDWACVGCRRYGSVDVQIAGGPRDPVTRKPMPKTTDDDLQRSLWQAHRKATSGLCARPFGELLVGLIWRWEQTADGRQMIALPHKGEPPPKKYDWPPWVA